MGRKVKEFEELVSEYTGANYALAMNNGTSTLHSILIALDIKVGDEVIVPSLAYISPINAILYQGAIPILCDNDPSTYNVTKENIKNKITKRTKAFITVDMKGLPVHYDTFKELSEETGIPFMSTGLESFGAIYKNKIVGTQANVHSFSFC